MISVDLTNVVKLRGFHGLDSDSTSALSLDLSLIFDLSWKMSYNQKGLLWLLNVPW